MTIPPPDSSASDALEQLGDYALLEKIADAAATVTWRAMQASVQREVALELLKPEYASNDAALRGFRALVRARASVVHQFITPVYEAQESNGTAYYTRELVKGRSLAELHRNGVRLNPHQVTSIFLASAEAISYLDSNGIPHSPLRPDDVHLGDDGIPRVDNLAIAEPDGATTSQTEVKEVATALSRLLHRGMPDSAKADSLLKAGQSGTLQGWPQVATQSREVLRSLSSSPSAVARGKQPSAPRAKGKRSPMGLVLGIILGSAGLAAGVMLALNTNSAPPPRDFESMSKVSAGSFRADSDSEPAEVSEFWIDTHEVTIAQYAEFLSALSSASSPSAFDHPEQPSSKNDHTPPQWDEMYRAAQNGSTFQGQPTDLNRPAILVDWWDAFAYAKWKGRRLPTAEEWGRAAVGEGGDRTFPWGKRDATERYNSGADFEQSGKGGTVDGFNYWAPVDAMAGDRSQAGVIGLAGNVSEWVDTWTHHPDFPDKRVPVVMGGSFASKNTNLTTPRPAKKPEATQLAVGFRTASSKAP